MKQAQVNVFNLLLQHISTYEEKAYTAAFYELVKNHIDAKAKKITVELNTTFKTAIISGDGNGISDLDFDRIFTNIASSIKSLGNKGLGLTSSFRLAPTILVSSKKDGKYYGAKLWIGKNEVGQDAFLYEAQEIKELHNDYLEATRKIMKFDSGSSWMLVGIGETRTMKYDFRFKIEKQFDSLQQTLSNDFHWRLHSDIATFELFFIMNSGKAKKITHNKVKLYGKQIEKDGFEYNNTFSENDKVYDLNVKFSLYTYAGDIIICCNSMDPLDLREEEGLKRKVGGLLKNDDVRGKHLSGYLNFTVTPKHKGGEIPDFYIASRTHLRWNSDFGNAFANIWLKAQEDKIKPALDEYLSEKESKKYDKICSSLAISFNECLKDEELKELFNVTYNTEKTKDETDKTPYKPTCRLCKSTNVTLNVVDREYKCHSCGTSWQYVKLGTPVRNPDDIKKYIQSGNKIKDRERLKGHIGITVTIWDDPEPKNIATCIGSQVYINAQHKYFKENEKKNERERKQFLINIMLEALIHEHCKGTNIDEHQYKLKFIAIYANKYYDKVSLAEFTAKKVIEHE